LFAAFTGQQHACPRQVHVVHGKPDRLGDPRTRSIQQLEQRPVPDGQRRAVDTGRLNEALHVVQADRFG